jgi:hypothetical protein
MIDEQYSPRLQGNLMWTDNKSIQIEARFDKVAVHDDKLMFISLVACSQEIKAMRAALAAGLTCPMRLKNVTLNQNDDSIEPEHVWPSPGGYRVESHRLGLGSIHAMFVCRQQGFLANDSDDALWRELKQERYTTPMMRGWLPYIRQELALKSLLASCDTLDCTCCVPTATYADLDAIVEAGIKNGGIAITVQAA